MAILWQDLRLRCTRAAALAGFTVAVLVLALGIGANSAMFTLVDAALIRPLPFHDPSGW